MQMLAALPNIGPLAKIAPVLYVVLISFAFIAVFFLGGWWLVSDRKEKAIERKISRLEAKRERHEAEQEARVNSLQAEVQALRSRLVELNGYLQSSRDEADKLRGALMRRDEDLRRAAIHIDHLERRIQLLESKASLGDYSVTPADRREIDAITAAVTALKL
jgi:predicted nuclease with TOPRIM domain